MSARILTTHDPKAPDLQWSARFDHPSPLVGFGESADDAVRNLLKSRKFHKELSDE